MPSCSGGMYLGVCGTGETKVCDKNGHPLFKMLLEDAEMEYGYCSEGPILLPCDVDLFYKVLAEMDSKEIDEEKKKYGRSTSFGFAYGSCTPFSPTRRPTKTNMAAEGLGSYGFLG